jgi:hypothetical protein
MLVALLAWTAPAAQGGVESASIALPAPVEVVTVRVEYDCGEVVRPLHSS